MPAPWLSCTLVHARGNYGKIEVARNLFPTHKIISLELVEDVCEIFLKKSHHIPAFWRAEVEIFFRTGIVGGSSPGQLLGNGILYDFWVCCRSIRQELKSRKRNSLELNCGLYRCSYGGRFTMVARGKTERPSECQPQKFLLASYFRAFYRPRSE